MKQTGNKYHAQKTRVYGKTYDSRAEAEYAMVLRAREKRGEIRNLEEQVRFDLIPKQALPEWAVRPGRKSIPGCAYIADFVFDDLKEMRHRVVDVKGMETPVFKLKRLLMLAVHGIYVEVVK